MFKGKKNWREFNKNEWSKNNKFINNLENLLIFFKIKENLLNNKFFQEEKNKEFLDIFLNKLENMKENPSEEKVVEKNEQENEEKEIKIEEENVNEKEEK